MFLNVFYHLCTAGVVKENPRGSTRINDRASMERPKGLRAPVVGTLSEESRGTIGKAAGV